MKSAAPDYAAQAMAGDYGTYGAEYRFSTVDETTDDVMRYVYAVWNELRGERDMPERGELSPRALGPALRYIQLFEVVEGGADFRCRVYGSAVAEQTGLQMTGQCLSGFENQRLKQRMTAAMRRVAETGTPVRMCMEHSALPHLAHKNIETIWLPMGGREGITHILSAVSFRTRQ
jgi:hypothetical protein